MTGRFGSANITVAKYCSRECWSVRSVVINKCKTCGVEIKTSKSVNKKYCNIECRSKGVTGRKLSAEHKSNISQSLKGKMPQNVFKSGDQHPFWNTERTNQRDRMTAEYRDWRFAVIKRDRYTCQLCGDKRSSGKKFHVDHIKPFALYPDLRLDVSNGRTLCEPCHRLTPTYGSGSRETAVMASVVEQADD